VYPAVADRGPEAVPGELVCLPASGVAPHIRTAATANPDYLPPLFPGQKRWMTAL